MPTGSRSSIFDQLWSINSIWRFHFYLKYKENVRPLISFAKNPTHPHTHLVKGPQISQTNRWNNSFQNMYIMNRQQLTVWPGKSIFCQKNTSFSPILVDTNLSYLTLEGPGRQTVDTRSTFGVALKSLGCNASN